MDLRLLMLLPMVKQLHQEGQKNITVVAVAVLGLNVLLYVFPAAAVPQACMNLHYVYTNQEWHRLFLSPLHHVDVLHLCINMASFLLLGVRLERRLGSAWFLYLLSVFSLLTGLVYLLLQAELTQLTQDSYLLGKTLDLWEHIHGCSVGFSGVLFALKVVIDDYNPDGVAYLLSFQVPNRYVVWAELVLTYLIDPGSSLVGHLAGILVGLVYTVGPLKSIMVMCAEFVSSDWSVPRPGSYFSCSGQASGRETPRSSRGFMFEEQVSLEELRRRRLRRLE